MQTRLSIITRQRRLQDDQGRPTFNVSFYALNRKGEHASASIWDQKQYAVHDGTRRGFSRVRICTRDDWPPSFY